jgi:ABC-type glycerol-3-phosphate transport system permease component
MMRSNDGRPTAVTSTLSAHWSWPTTPRATCDASLFLYSWNDFFAPLLYLIENPNLWTLSLGLSEFKGQFDTDWNLTMAASVLFIVPVIILFLFAQRAFIECVKVTGIKG